MAAPEKVTEDQANAALQQLAGMNADGSEVVAEPEPEEPAVEEPPTEPEPEAAAEPSDAAPQTTTDAAETDDVQSLKKRLDAVEADRKRDAEQNAERLRAIQDRHSANEKILRDRHLRKSSIADKALRTLKAVRTSEGVPEAEVDRIIAELQGTMNPDSASYAPPPETYQQANEDQIVTLNSFLNEKGMTQTESTEFGNWLRGDAITALTPQEQAVASQSLDGFLRLAHTRFTEGQRETAALNAKRVADAAAAVKAAQRIQRAAASAATTPSAAPRKSPTTRTAAPKRPTKDEVAELLRQSVMQAEAGG